MIETLFILCFIYCVAPMQASDLHFLASLWTGSVLGTPLCSDGLSTPTLRNLSWCPCFWSLLIICSIGPRPLSLLSRCPCYWYLLIICIIGPRPLGLFFMSVFLIPSDYMQYRPPPLGPSFSMSVFFNSSDYMQYQPPPLGPFSRCPCYWSLLNICIIGPRPLGLLTRCPCYCSLLIIGIIGPPPSTPRASFLDVRVTVPFWSLAL